MKLSLLLAYYYYAIVVAALMKCATKRTRRDYLDRRYQERNALFPNRILAASALTCGRRRACLVELAHMRVPSRRWTETSRLWTFRSDPYPSLPDKCKHRTRWAGMHLSLWYTGRHPLCKFRRTYPPTPTQFGTQQKTPGASSWKNIVNPTSQEFSRVMP